MVLRVTTLFSKLEETDSTKRKTFAGRSVENQVTSRWNGRSMAMIKFSVHMGGGSGEGLSLLRTVTNFGFITQSSSLVEEEDCVTNPNGVCVGG